MKTKNKKKTEQIIPTDFQMELDLEYSGPSPEEATQLQRRIWDKDDEERYCSTDRAPEPDIEWKMAIYASDAECAGQDGYLARVELSAYVDDQESKMHPYFSNASRRRVA